MGLFDDFDFDDEELEDDFLMRLTSDNVVAVFDYCFAGTNLPPTDNLAVGHLFRKEYGYDKESKPFVFYKDRLREYALPILYMCGQLKSVHELGCIHLDTSNYTVSDKNWIRTPADIGKLFNMANALELIGDFVQSSNTASCYHVTPTFSTLDPRFKKWWEEDGAKEKWDAIKLKLEAAWKRQDEIRGYL